MRIIENPNPVEEKVLVCEGCGCKFAYTPGDVFIDSWNNGVLGPGYYGYVRKLVTCPNCGKSILIEERNSEQAKQERWKKEAEEAAKYLDPIIKEIHGGQD